MTTQEEDEAYMDEIDYDPGPGQSEPSFKFVKLPMPFSTTAQIIAGPYKDKPDPYPGIKLAAEFDLPCAIDLPIPDYHVPDVKACERAVYAAIVLIWQGATPYAGCWGGKGRTGVFMGVLAKVALRSTRGLWVWRHADPVDWIREHYRPEACETKEQEEYVRNFDTRWLEKQVRSL